MKLFALSVLLLVFFSYELYQQRQRITTLEASLIQSNQQVAKLQAALAATKAARAQATAGQVPQPPAPPQQPDNSWMFKGASPLDAPAHRH